MQTWIDKDDFFAPIIVATNSFHMFNVNELEDGMGQLVDLGVEVQDVFTIMWKTSKPLNKNFKVKIKVLILKFLFKVRIKVLI